MPRKKNTKKQYYFEKEQEDAFVNYLNATDNAEKEKIFNTCLLPAFTKMTESIIRRYNLYIPDENFEETFHDTISFLMTKINNFKQKSSFKAYSYTGTIIKNYLIYKINAFDKQQKRNTQYSSTDSSINDSIKFSSVTDDEKLSMLTELMKEESEMISFMIENKDKYNISDNEVIVGNALIDVLENWDYIFDRFGSNKFNKSAVLLYLKEMTNMDTKTIRSSMQKFKDAYYEVKKKVLK